MCVRCFAGMLSDSLDSYADEAGQPPEAGERYDIGKVLGRGANGVVYLAEDRLIGRHVALKRLDHLAADAAAQLRFQVELEAIAGLDHPHIVPVYDHGELEGQPFFSMRYLRGGTLAERMGDFGQPRRAVELFLQIVAAVAHAHENGVLHRDIKPENVLLDAEGRAYLSDFGLAKRLDGGDADLSLTGSVMGTPSYMAPEQARGDGEAVTTATDVFSLGTVLFRMLSGRRPFGGGDTHEVLRRVIEEEAKFDRDEERRIGKDLATICLKCLRKEPEHRYATARELEADLERYLAGEPIAARRMSTPERAVHWVRRKTPGGRPLGCVCRAARRVAHFHDAEPRAAARGA